jgi:hypothetical protein
MDNQHSDWEIGNLYSRAYKIVKSHKILWALGAAASVGGYSSNFQSTNSFDSKTFQNMFQSSNPEISNTVTQAVGTPNTTDPSTLVTFQNLFYLVPMSQYFLLGVEVLTLVVFGLILSLIYQAWSQAVLLNAVDQAIDHQKISIKDSSHKALGSIKPLIWLQIIPGLVLTVSAILVIGVLVVGITLGSSLVKVLFIFLTFLAVTAFIGLFIYLLVIQIWATRLAALEGKSGRVALSLGYKIARKKFWASLLLGTVNTILVGIVTFIPIMFLVVIFGGAVFAIVFTKSFSIWMIPVGVILGIGIMFFITLLMGALNSFKATVWNLAFKSVKKYL